MKAHFIKIEESIWDNIPFEYQGLGYKFLYSLSEKMELTTNYLNVGIISELDVDHDEFKEKLRKISPEYSEDSSYQKDVQLIFDENLVNHLLLALHHSSKPISLRELLISIIPEKYHTYLMLAQALFQTTTFSYFLPDLLKEFPHGKLLDVRCGLSKNFLQGKFEDLEDSNHGIHASQVKFHIGNNLEFDLGLGCGMFVYMG